VATALNCLISVKQRCPWLTRAVAWSASSAVPTCWLSSIARTRRSSPEVTDDIILHQLLLDPGKFMVTVADGVVTVRGNPETTVLGHNLVEKIRHVQGVVAVRDELAYPPHEQSISGQYS
jgi:hypothetical protein